jgi:hypothetical protein
MIKSTPIEVASIGGIETRLITGAAPGSSSFRKEGTGVDVLAGGAFTTEASRTLRNNGAEDYDNEDPPLDDAAAKTSTLGERASDERGTLRMQHLWINFFFTILAMARLKR